MKRYVLFGMSVAIVGAAGCGAPLEPGPGGGGGGGGGGGPVTTFRNDTHFSRFIATQTNNAGDAVAVVDRSIDEQDLNTSRRYVNGNPIDADVTVSGTMGGGVPVPGDDDLPLVAGSQADAFPSYQTGDSFLGEVESGESYRIVTYRTRVPNRRFTGWGVDGTETAVLPSSGVATYTGTVNGTVFGSQTRESALTGTSSLTADFNPMGRTVTGRLSNLRVIQDGDNAPLGSDIRLLQSNIIGNGYHAGVQVVRPGTNTESGTGSFGSYNGAFYGSTAKETAGTFQFGASNIPIVDEITGLPTGAFENMEGVGAFGGFRPGP